MNCVASLLVVCLRALEDLSVVPPTTRIALGRCSLSTREGALRFYVTPNNATFIYFYGRDGSCIRPIGGVTCSNCRV